LRDQALAHDLIHVDSHKNREQSAYMALKTTLIEPLLKWNIQNISHGFLTLANSYCRIDRIAPNMAPPNPPTAAPTGPPTAAPITAPAIPY
jgi:hypothetical protein